jgi:hypothetical protein
MGTETLSSHARLRMQQRGIRRETLALVREQADIVKPVGAGCLAVSLSRARIGFLRGAGWPPAELDRAAAVTLVEAEDGAVVTALHRRGRAGRRYFAAA